MKYFVGILMSVLGACEFPRLQTVGGTVRGLWDGTDGVELRLQAGAVDKLVTAPKDGLFQFLPALEVGTPYTVTVEKNPVDHTCIVEAGGNGVVSDTDTTNASIACTGPAAIAGKIAVQLA